MDPEAVLEFSNWITKLTMYPYFDIAHSILCALAVREDLGPGMYNELANFTFDLLNDLIVDITQEAKHFRASIHFRVGCPLCWSYSPVVW